MQNILSILGTEGCGHHMINACAKFKKGGRSRSLEKKLLDHSMMPNAHWKAKVKAELKARDEQGAYNFIDASSFPFGRPYRAISRHDIKNFYEILTENGANVFFVVLYRNIVHSAFSTYSRFDVKLKNIYHTARYQEDALLYINSQIQILPQEKLLIVDYDDLCQHPTSFEKILIEKSGFNDFHFLPENIKISKRNKEGKAVDLLTEFFDDKRMSQFKFIFDNMTKLS